MELKYGQPLEIKELKEADDAWTVSGYASTFGNTDLGGDVVMHGAFDATIANGHRVRFFRQHKPDAVLGKTLALRVDDTGLYGDFKISKTPLGEETHQLLKDGALDAFSIGFITQEAEFDTSGVRLIKQLDLYEVSVVAMGMNERAQVMSVKAIDRDQPFDSLLTQVTDALQVAVEEAKALKERREATHREFPERHLEAVQTTLARAKALSGELEALVVTPEQVKAVGGIKLRLALARRSYELRAKGIPLEITA